MEDPAPLSQLHAVSLPASHKGPCSFILTRVSTHCEKLITLFRELLGTDSVLTPIQETSNVLRIHQAKACRGEVIYGILTDICLTVDS